MRTRMQRDNEAGSSRLSRYTRTREIVANRKEAIDTCGGLTRLASAGTPTRPAHLFGRRRMLPRQLPDPLQGGQATLR
jgi:hypothetical protein